MPKTKETTLSSVRPVMARAEPFKFALCVLLCVVVIGIPLLLVWYLQTLCTRVIVTDRRTILRRGILSKHTNEVFHADVRNTRVSQSFLQRILGVGSLAISSSGQGDVEIAVAGIPGPYRLKTLIDEHRGG